MKNKPADHVVKILILFAFIASFAYIIQSLVATHYIAPYQLPDHMTKQEKLQFKARLTGD